MEHPRDRSSSLGQHSASIKVRVRTFPAHCASPATGSSRANTHLFRVRAQLAIGVLARLAERDALRGIEVISTVSGGAIFGAFYYLRVRELVNSTPTRRSRPTTTRISSVSWQRTS
jgi:hypothetical protein